jgi:hypothetical protein
MNICLSCDGRYSDEELQNIANILNIKPSFEHNGIHITDSSMDESGRFEVNPIEYYGAKAFPDLIEVYFGFVEGWEFDQNDPSLKIYKGYKTKTDNTWNGWLVPFVTEQVKDEIIKNLKINDPETWDKESQELMNEYISEKPNDKGLYCVGFGLCWDQVDLDDLREAYKDYCKQEKLECIDAQEYLFQSTKCTKKQYEWIKNFCVVWDMIESKESE